MIFPIVNINGNLTITSNNLPALTNIYKFLSSNMFYNHPIRNSLPRPMDNIVQSGELYEIDCGRYDPHYTAPTPINFSFEYIRIALTFLLKFNIFIEFYIPSLSFSENNNDFFYFTMLNHILIPKLITEIKSSSEIYIDCLLKIRAFLKKSFNFKRHTFEHTTLGNLISRAISNINLGNILLSADFFMNFQYKSYYDYVNFNEFTILDHERYVFLRNIFKIDNLQFKNTTIQTPFHYMNHLLKELCIFEYDGEVIYIYISKISRNNSAIFCMINNTLFDLNELDSKRYFFINCLIFAFINKGITIEENYKVVNNNSIRGIFYHITLSQTQELEMFFCSEDYDRVIITEKSN